MWSTGNGPYPSVPNSYETVSRPKRRKIEIACTTCRLRKSRCDGGVPKCGACMRRRNVGLECVYIDASLDNQINLSPSSLTTGRPTEDQAANDVSIHDSGGDISTTTTPQESHPAGSGVHQDSDWKLKAGLLAASSSTKFFNTIFGSSNEQQPQNETSDPPKSTTQEHAPQRKLHRLTSTSRRKSFHSPEYVLPSRQVADDLLNRFFNHVYIQWFDRAEFLGWYETLWTGNVRHDDPLDEQINYALLNMIFALVYRTEVESIAEDQEQLAQVHFLRAERLLQLDILSFNRINLLYALFMFLQWYQSVNDVQRCNSLVRLCILVAQNIGLDIPEKVANLRNQRSREMARRAWHGCVLMDRIIAMVSGQPLKISQELAKGTTLFRAIDDEYLSVEGADGQQPSNKPSSHLFFLAFCQLHLILGDILAKSQSDRHENRVQLDVNHILEIDENLNKFSKSLPLPLSFKIDNQIHDSDDGRRIHLQTRFLHIRILLFRPFFLRAAEVWKRDDLTLTQQFAHAITLQGLRTCVVTAQDLLTLLGSRLNADIRGPHLVPQWWHTVAYVYTAATILIAAHIFPPLLEEVTAQSLSECIETGFQILDVLSQQKETAKQCKKALVMLYDRHAKHIRETPKRTPHGTLIPLEQSQFNQFDTDLSMDLEWAFADPLDIFHDRDANYMAFSGDLFSTEMSNWL